MTAARERALVICVDNKLEKRLSILMREIVPSLVYLPCDESQLTVATRVIVDATGFRTKLESLNPSNPKDVARKIFAGLSYLAERFGKQEVFVDFSSGQGIALSFCAAVSCLLGLRIFEVTDQDGFRELPNPFQTLGILISTRAVELFNDGAFESARKLFDQMTQVVAVMPISELARSMQVLCDCYSAWERFEYKCDDVALATTLKRVAKELANMERFLPIVGELRDQLLKNIGFIESVLGTTKGGSQSSSYFVLDLFANGIRRMDEARFEDAALRFYRCVEAILQLQLRKHGIEASSPDFKKLGKSVETDFLTRTKRSVLPDKLGLFDSYALLYCLRDSLCQKVKEKNVLDLMQIRNFSVLGHGFAVVSRRQAERCKEVSEELVRLLFSEEKLDFDELFNRTLFLNLVTERIHSAIAEA